MSAPRSLWVKVVNSVDKVSTVGCEDIDDFAEAIKQKFAPKLDNVPAADLSVFLNETEGDALKRSYSLHLIPKNDEEHPMSVKFPSSLSTPPAEELLDRQIGTCIDPECGHSIREHLRRPPPVLTAIPDLSDVVASKRQKLDDASTPVTQTAVSLSRHQEYKASQALVSLRHFLTIIAQHLHTRFQFPRTYESFGTTTFGDVIKAKEAEGESFRAKEITERPIRSTFSNKQWEVLQELNTQLNVALHVVYYEDGTALTVTMPKFVTTIVNPQLWFSNVAVRAGLLKDSETGLLNVKSAGSISGSFAHSSPHDA